MIDEIDENAPRGLQIWFYSSTLDLDALIYHPEWIKWLEGRDEYVKAHMDIEYYDVWSTSAREYNAIPHEVDVYMSMLYEEELRRDVLNRERIRSKALTDEFKAQNQDLFFDDLPEEVLNIFEDDYYSLSHKCERLMQYKDLLKNKKIFLAFDRYYDRFFEFCESIDVAFDLIIKYGAPDIKSIKNWSLETEEQNLTKEEQFRKILYRNIEEHNLGNREFMPDDFKEEYPELFLTKDDVKIFEEDSAFGMWYDHDFYCGEFNVKNINEEIAKVLRTKNIRAAMRTDYDWIIDLCGGDADKFIDVALEYGDILNNYKLQQRGRRYSNKKIDSVEENTDLIEIIDNLIYECIMLDDAKYNGRRLPERFQRKHPELFLLPEEIELLISNGVVITTDEWGLNDDIEMENRFYNGQISFSDIGRNDALRNIIKSKDLSKCMACGSNATEVVDRFAKVIGGDKNDAIDLLAKNFSMHLDYLLGNIDGRQIIEKLVAFYSEMEFIPHPTVVRKFPKERVGDFRLNKGLWRALMENPEYNDSSDAIGSLIEAAIVMGVFETKSFEKKGEIRLQGAGKVGFDKLQSLLGYIPEFLSDPFYSLGGKDTMEFLGEGYMKIQPDHFDEILYEAIEKAAKEEELYDELVQGDLSESDINAIEDAMWCTYGMMKPYMEIFEIDYSNDKYHCVIDRDMNSKIKMLFRTMGVKRDDVLFIDEFNAIEKYDESYILKAFRKTDGGYDFNINEIDGKFIIGGNTDISDEESKKNKRLFDYVKYLMLEYGLTAEARPLAANNDRSDIMLYLDEVQMKKITEAANKISERAQEKYEKSELWKVKEDKKKEVRWMNYRKLHTIFDGLEPVYNEKFRDFLVENFQDIIEEFELTSRINSIQKKIIEMSNDPAYEEIKLTPEVVLRALSEIEYIDKKVGFEKGEELAAKFAFTQEQFNEAQEIWEEARRRNASSIPRIEGKDDEYSYEVLRLDDALGIFVGNITNCCQKVDGLGESAMLHSMIEKSGRVFVVRDRNKKIVAQSWLWRNGNIICFDNVEIPNSADNYKNQQAVYDILKTAAKELCDKDSEVLEQLVENGKIDKSKAELMKVKKVTVGMGNTDIDAIRNNCDPSKADLENRLPLQSKDYDLYTSDSRQQVILYEAEDYEKNDEVAVVMHTDENIEKTSKDITVTDIKTIVAIEGEFDEQELSNYTEISTTSDLAKLYGVDKEKLSLVMGTDWFMLYSENEKDIVVHKMLKSPSSGIKMKSIREQREAVDMLMHKGKEISMEFENDRVYKAAKLMIKNMEKKYTMNIEDDEDRIRVSEIEER